MVASARKQIQAVSVGRKPTLKPWFSLRIPAADPSTSESRDEDYRFFGDTLRSQHVSESRSEEIASLCRDDPAAFSEVDQRSQRF